MKPTSVLTIALALLAAAPAQDTTLGDARWAPWLGCWHLLQDDRGSLAAAATNPDDVVVCVLPASGNRGVSMTTYVGGQSILQQTVVADGARHPVSEPECSGSQTSEWSLSGQRLLTRADITCIGQPARTVSAITLMAAGPTWVDIQAVGTDQDAPVRVRRYRRTDSLPQSVVLPADLQGRPGAVSARLAGPTVMTLEEVVEASRKVAAPAVAAALYETGSRFDLNGRTLKALAGGGVPDGVVDVMVALSFPGHVAIDRPFRGSTGQTRGATTASVHRSTRLPSYSYSANYYVRSVLPAFCVRSVLRLPPVPSVLLLLLAVRLLKLVGRSLSTLLLPRPASRHYSPWRVSATRWRQQGQGPRRAGAWLHTGGICCLGRSAPAPRGRGRRRDTIDERRGLARRLHARPATFGRGIECWRPITPRREHTSERVRHSLGTNGAATTIAALSIAAARPRGRAPA